jgi:hypothetical protein
VDKKYFIPILLSVLSLTVFASNKAAEMMPQNTEPVVFLESDLNRDGYVDISDFAIFSQQWLNEADPNSI